MAIQNHYKQIDPKLIHVDRESRQRRIIDTSDLEPSIRQHGVLSPLLVEARGEELWLIFGERRLTTALKLGLALVPVRLASELTPIERQLIELEENVKRSDLTWRDQCAAIGKLHESYVVAAPADAPWTQTATAEKLGFSPTHIGRTLRVFRDLDSPKIAGAPELVSAFNILVRSDERKCADALSDLMETTAAVLAPPAAQPTATAQDASTAPTDAPAPAAPPVPAAPLAPPESILQTSFLTWAPSYDGPRFNFIHCDFPYGIDFNAGFGGAGAVLLSRTAEERAANRATTYDDSPDTYWSLCRCLAENLDRICAHSAHLMFWTSADQIAETLEFFRQHAPSLIFRKIPLIWHKSDNRGILADPKRAPRHIYEVALIAAREDRLLVRATSDVYSAPTDKSHHPSTKPEPMLRYFFQMFVDEGSKVLDPTCGGGSALRAAESLGAAQVLGLEIDPDHCAAARSALRSFRTIRALSA